MRRMIAIAAALAVLGAFPIGGCGGGSPSVAEEQSAAPDSTAVDALVRRFAPVIWVHREEKFGPASPDEFVASSTLLWRRFLLDKQIAREGEVAPGRLGSACGELEPGCYREDGALATDFTRPLDKAHPRPPGVTKGEGFYLDPPDSARRGVTGREPDVPVYYEVRQGESATRITYWFFYGYSHPHKPVLGLDFAKLVSHEGDWENVDVVLEPDGSPRGAFYYGHGKAEETEWPRICKLVEGEEDCTSGQAGRPVVYSALFSHASYSTPAAEIDETSKVCKTVLGRRICSYDFRNRGFLWDPLVAGGLRPVREQPWYGFGGAWGKTGRIKDMTGPLGPSPYKQSDDPEPGEQAPAPG